MVEHPFFGGVFEGWWIIKEEGAMSDMENLNQIIISPEDDNLEPRIVGRYRYQTPSLSLFS